MLRSVRSLARWLGLAAALLVLLAVTADGPVLSWTPPQAHPGFYAARDWRDLDPAIHGLVGGHQTFYWDDLNPSQGQYDWGLIERFLERELDAGKRPALGIVTFNGRANEGQADPAMHVPQWVFDAGAGVIACPGTWHAYPEGDPRRDNPPPFEIPKYWDPIYLDAYADFVAALAAEYDGDPRIEFMQIGVGKFGETQPCDDRDDPYVLAALEADGHTAYTWGDVIVPAIVALWDRPFGGTRLLLVNAPTFGGDRRAYQKWTDDAIARGIGLHHASLLATQETVDLRSKPGWEGVGMFDRVLAQVEAFEAGQGPEEWVTWAQEAYHDMTPTPTEFYWGVLGALSRRVDYITVEGNLLYLNGRTPRPELDEYVAIMRWAGEYMGKPLAETPSAWVALREAGYQDSWYPQKGNYRWWLEQVDAPGAQSVVATYRSARELVHDADYDAYGEAATVRAEIETDQAFLGRPSAEGWICRRTDAASGNPRMAFRLDDRYLYGQAARATVTVTYLDRGTDAWQLTYDALGDPNKIAGTITKGNTGAWRIATFTLEDAFFANDGAGGSDLQIDSLGDGDEYLHMVDVRIPRDQIAAPEYGLALSLAAERQTAHLGETLAYTLCLTNTGNTLIEGVQVTAPQLGLEAELRLRPSEPALLHGVYGPLSEADLPAVTTVVTATHPLAGEAQATAEVLIETQPALALGLLADRAEARPGQDIRVRALITNTGDVTLHHVQLAAPDLGLVGGFEHLAPGRAVEVAASYLVTEEDLPGPWGVVATAESDETAPQEARLEVALAPQPTDGSRASIPLVLAR